MTSAPFAAALFAIIVGSIVPDAARAQDAPTADELAARSRQTTGADRRPESQREIWSIRAGGLEGTLETAHHGADVVNTTTLGPFRMLRGVFHGERWHQNENGETVLDRPEPSQAERIVAQSVARVRQPVDAWQVTTSFASGHITRTFYDPRNYVVVRTEKTVAGRTIRATFDDFRTDARGRTRAWHYAGSEERGENDYDYHLLRTDDGEIGDAELAIPRDRRSLVEFPPGVDAVRLPARIVADRIYVRLTIAGRGLDFLLDTGAASLTIDETVARQLNLAGYGHAAQTVAGTFQTRRVIAPEIGVGALAMHDVVLRTAPFHQREGRDTRVVGLLGFDFIDALGLKIDYANGTVDGYRQATLVPPAGVAPLDVRLNAGVPIARATIGDATGDDFILDTGADFTYVIFQRFARAHPESIAPVGASHALSGSGVGGSMSYRTIAIKRLGLGASVFENVTGAEALSASAFGFDNEDGLIGADILKSFTVYLDYAGYRIFFGPRSRVTTAPKSRR